MFFDFEKERIEFLSFDEFFDYVQGNIYENACYYGYTFSDNEVEKNSLCIQKMNFDSFIDYDIDKYSYELINSEKEEIVSRRKSTIELLDWIDKCDPISSMEKLKEKCNEFCLKFNLPNNEQVFYSFIVRKYKDVIKTIVIEDARQNAFIGFKLDDVLFNYGLDAANYVVDNYNGGFCSVRSKKETIKKLKDKILKYSSGALERIRNSGFSDELQLYYVIEQYYFQNRITLSRNEYFGTFDDFIDYLQGDLREANLSKAKIDGEKLSRCKIDATTRLPIAEGYESYHLIKEYKDNNFVVIQKWINKDKKVVLSKTHSFEHFFDFVHFLKGDLAGADLIFCDGIENIKNIDGLNLENVRVRSNVAKVLGLPLQLLPESRKTIDGFQIIEKNELMSMNALQEVRQDEVDYSGLVSYITDIHLTEKIVANNCQTKEDEIYFIGKVAEQLSKNAEKVNLIGGDTCDDIETLEIFIRFLLSFENSGDYFFTLGNHEFWKSNGEALSSIISSYKKMLKETERVHLVQNNLFYMIDSSFNNLNIWKEITEEELANISIDELKEKTRRARLIIFGGIGFSGENEEFNADNNVYVDALNREQEIKETNKFCAIYKKVVSSLKGKNLIILTHMPMKDWGGKKLKPCDGVVYINGHTHNNYFIDDGKVRIYADNQIGYKGNKFHFKKIGFNFDYNFFAYYKDGIYEITRDDYLLFYRGIKEEPTFNRDYEKLYLLKREGTYMFLIKNSKGNLLLLNGGAATKVDKQDLEYYYENMVKYSKAINCILSKYVKFQKKVAYEVKQFGGEGKIHGCIIDIDFYNHIYINPLDGKLTPYYALSILDKKVYKNIPSLLKYECPELYTKYKEKREGFELLAPLEENLLISKKSTSDSQTDIYKISRIIKGLQFITEYNIIRFWDDAILSKSLDEIGRTILKMLINTCN